MALLKTLKFIADHPMNRGHLVRSVGRYLRWQILCRLTSGVRIYDWVNGSRFGVRKGETGLTGNIYTGLHEFQDMAFVLHFLREGDLFLDVGANMGSYTILACAAAGANGLAFEPVPDTFRRLMENIRLNALEPRVEAISKCVADTVGSVDFTSDSDTTNHVLAAGEVAKAVTRVEQATLDHELAGRAPHLIKIDVEGHELAVLTGAKEVLNSPSLKAAIVEIDTSNGQAEKAGTAVFDIMARYGFSAYSYDPIRRALTPVRASRLGMGNTLFLRDLKFIEKRLSEAPAFTIYGKHI